MWKYEQSTGKMIDPAGSLVATGYAGGNGGKNPEGVNNPEMQNIKCVGPLPQGIYTMKDPIVTGSHLGPFAIPLFPDPKNTMFGRGSFYIHGDRSGPPPRRASEGCIIMPNAIRKAMWKSTDHQIEVVA